MTGVLSAMYGLLAPIVTFATVSNRIANTFSILHEYELVIFRSLTSESSKCVLGNDRNRLCRGNVVASRPVFLSSAIEILFDNLFSTRQSVASAHWGIMARGRYLKEQTTHRLAKNSHPTSHISLKTHSLSFWQANC